MDLAVSTAHCGDTFASRSYPLALLVLFENEPCPMLDYRALPIFEQRWSSHCHFLLQALERDQDIVTVKRLQLHVRHVVLQRASTSLLETLCVDAHLPIKGLDDTPCLLYQAVQQGHSPGITLLC